MSAAVSIHDEIVDGFYFLLIFLFFPNFLQRVHLQFKIRI